MDFRNLAHITPEMEDVSVSKRFTLLNLDEEFAKTLGARVINNETLTSQKLSKEFTDAIYYNSDGELGFVPTCPCGETKGVAKEGLPCPKCGELCSSQFIDHLTHMSWISIPEQMAPVLHPIWYMILHAWTSIGRRDISVVDIILNPDLEIPDDLQPYIEGRGFQYFYDNADKILDMLLYRYPKTVKKPMTPQIRVFREYYRSVMFTRKLPILHNSLHPLKCNGGTLNYVDDTSKDILSAIIDLSTETFKQHATAVSFKQVNKNLMDIYQRIITYYKGLLNKKLGGKQALLRKHCFGSRIHFSFRSVVVPQAIPLPMDEVLLPWGMMLVLLQYPILNHLTHRHHKNFVEAFSIYRKALRKYDPLIDKIMQRIIYECVDHKLTIGLGRNPINTRWAMVQ